MIEYISNNYNYIIQLTIEHLIIVLTSIVISIIIALPIGIFISFNENIAKRVIAAANILMTIPSIALFGLMLPILAPFNLSLGKTPAIIALVLYNQLPIISNTYSSLKNIDRTIISTAKAIGLSNWHILKEVTIPMSIPIIIGGIRTASVLSIGITAIAAYIGAGGLGVLIQMGISRIYFEMVLAGAIFISVIAIIFDVLMYLFEYIITPKGILIQRKTKKL
ncbi:MAG: ABC transporter permease [Deferribacterota bacterium]|nr:ABC transporter permease [Deferribacterota bacterium]